MKLVSFSESDGLVRPWNLLEESSMVIDLTTAGYADTLAVIASWSHLARCWRSLSGLSAQRFGCMRRCRIRRASSALASTIATTPSSRAWRFPSFPVVFFKLVPSIIGPGEAIVLPPITKEPDYEAEFAFVIGKGGFEIPRAKRSRMSTATPSSTM
jgi:hypothetical protein